MSDQILSEWRGASRVSGLIGSGLDKLHEEAREKTHRSQGGKIALLDLAKKLEGLHKKADVDFDEGKFAGLKEREVLAFVKTAITDAIESAKNLAGQHAATAAAQAGAEVALRRAVELAQKHHDASVKRVRQLEAVPAPGTPEHEEERQVASSDASKRTRTLAEIKAGIADGTEKPKPKPKKRTTKKAAKKTAKKAPRAGA